jgi:hypothetical protein
VFALSADGTAAAGGNPADSYTPTNFQALQNGDTDIGSTAAVFLPAPPNSAVRHLAAQSGKDAKLRLLNLDNMSGQGGPGRTGGELSIINVPQGNQVLTMPAAWVNPADNRTWMFVANDTALAGMQLNIDGSGTPSLSTPWQSVTPGTSPIIANGVLYYATKAGQVRALDPTSGNILWRGSIGAIHWASPIVANGILYIADGGTSATGRLTAFSIGGVAPSVTPATTIQFSSANNSVNEGCATATLTVNRSGDLTGTTAVDFLTSDAQAQQRTDYTLASGTLTFAPGESSKTLQILITRDAYVEGNETLNVTLSNPTGCAVTGNPNTTSVTIIDDPTIPTGSQPIDDSATFVCQHYHDFLAREPDTAGATFWTGQIAQCGNDQSCIRTERDVVSNAFCFESEFQQTAAYVYRIYRAFFGNNQPFPNPNPDPQYPGEEKKVPGYLPFMKDRARVIGGAQLAQLQLGLANAAVQRPECLAKYPASLDGPGFVDAVLATIKNDLGVDLSTQRQALIDQFNTGGRGNVVYRLADDNAQNPINNRAFIDAEYNRAFVFTEYAGYLRRDSDMAGYLFWLAQVNSAPLRDVSQQHAMVCSFINSVEYQQRFSAAVTHSVSECSR